ncbi:NUDIX hydrolase [Streptomyces nodosus]|uniref:NUDIX hydrolase n=1 Tax=Streptomyces nodosus TaxID=40318 RepID=UPI003453386C
MPEQRQSSVVPAPIRRRRAIEVFGNRFGRLYNDDVVFPSGARGSYLRWQWNQQGVVVVPVGPAGLALVPAYRYPVGAASLEFPRGGCEPGEDPQAAARRELKEESGLKALSVRNLGQIHTDTGLIETSAHVCLAIVQPATDAQARPEATESVAAPVWLPKHLVLERLQQGRITCAVTLAAFAMAMAELDRPASASAHFAAQRTDAGVRT